MKIKIFLEFRDARDLLIEKIDLDELDTNSYPIPDGAVNYRAYLEVGEQGIENEEL